jgi:hypothetical protein
MLLVEPHYLGVLLGVSKVISKPILLHFAQTVHPSCIQMYQKEIPHDPRHAGVPLGASKIIFEPMVRLVQTMNECCIKRSTVSKLTETSF